MDNSKQVQYLDLRKKLNQYQYSASFGIDSLELVDNLFKDIVSVTGSYKELQEKELRLANDLSLAQAQLFPLRKENARLARENHQLHLASVKKADEFDEYISKHLEATKSASDEVQELRIKLNAKEEQFYRKEKELERLKESYEMLMNQSKSSTSGKRTIKVSNHIPKSTSSSSSSGLDESKLEGRSYSDLRKSISDDTDSDIIITLRQKLSQAENTIKDLESTKFRLTQSLSSRDEEFARLTKLANDTKFLLQQAGVSETIDNRSEQAMITNLANKRVIDQLNSQIDFLNEQLALREDQVVRSSDNSLELESLRLEFHHLEKQNNEFKQINSKLSGQVRALEKKLMDLDQVMDPEGGISISQLLQSTEPKILSTVSDPISSGMQSKSKTYGGRKTSENKFTSPNIRKNVTAPSSTTVTATAINNDTVNTTRLSNLRSIQKSKPDVNVLVSKLSTEKNSLTEEVETLQNRVSGLQINDNVLKERLRRSEEMINSLKSELQIANQQLESSSRLVATKEMEITKLRDDLIDLKQAYKTLNDQFLDEENKKFSLESKSNAMERSLHDAIRDRQQLLDVIETLKSDIREAKTDRVNALIDKDRLEKALSHVEKDLETYGHAMENSNTELHHLRKENVTSSIRIEQLESDLDNVKRIAHINQQANDETKAALESKMKDLNETSQRLAFLQSVQSSSTTIDQLREDIKSLRNQCSKLLDEKLRWTKEKESLEIQLTAAQSADQNRQILEEYSQQEQASLQQEIINKDRSIYDLSQERNRLELEKDHLKHELDQQKQVYLSLVSSMDEKGDMISQKNDTLKNLQSEFNLLQVRYNDTIETNENLSSQLESLSQSLSHSQDRCNKYEKENLSLQEQILLLQRENDQIKIDYDTMKRHYESLERRQVVSKEDVHIAQEEKQTLLYEISQLRALITTMEIASKTQNSKIHQLMSNLDNEIESGKQLSQSNDQLNRKIKEMNEQIKLLHDTIHDLDEERDSLQLDLDDKIDQLRVMEENRRNLENQVIQLRQVIESLEGRLVETNNDLMTNQRHGVSLETRIHSLLEENKELKRRLSSKSQEVGSAAQDLHLMTQENQALTSELASTVSESERLRQRLSELMSINSQLEQSKRGLEIEREDLLNTYRSVLVEKNKLENDLVNLGSMKQKAGLGIQQLQNQLAETKGIVNAYESSEQKWQAERSSLHRQIDKMSEEIGKSERKVEAIEADNRRLLQDTYGLRQTNGMLNDRMQLLIKRINELSESNKIMSTRLSSLERERDALASLLGIERQKSFDMSKLVENARSQLAGKEHELQRIRSELSLSSPISKTSPTYSEPTFGLSPSKVSMPPQSSSSSTVAAAGGIENEKDPKSSKSSPSVDSVSSGSVISEIQAQLNKLNQDIHPSPTKKMETSQDQDLNDSLGWADANTGEDSSDDDNDKDEDSDKDYY